MLKAAVFAAFLFYRLNKRFNTIHRNQSDQQVSLLAFEVLLFHLKVNDPIWNFPKTEAGQKALP